MFKYLWIIILIIFICAIVGYTIYIAYESFKEASEKETNDIKEVLLETWDSIVMYHEPLVMSWLIILIVGTIVLFIVSIVSYIAAI